jgi:hypothetical protein
LVLGRSVGTGQGASISRTVSQAFRRKRYFSSRQYGIRKSVC